MAKLRSKTYSRHDWFDWLNMAEGFLAAASQMAWQNSAEQAENRQLFAKVLGHPASREEWWKSRVTWAGAVVLGLSAEHSLKAFAVRAEGKYLSIHNLECLWKKLRQDDREGVLKAWQSQNRDWAAKGGGGVLASCPTPSDLNDLDTLIRHHKDVFVNSRYYRVEDKGDLTLNPELWVFAISLVCYGRELAGPNADALWSAHLPGA